MNHEAVEFREQEYPAQRSTVARDGEDLLVGAVCPQCHAETEWPIRVARPGVAKRKAARKAAPDIPENSYALCACGFTHEKRPADAGESGCGAYWPIEVTDAV
jgi:hypothetical protein